MNDHGNSSSSQPISSLGLLAGAGALAVYGLSRRSKTSLALATAAGGLLALQQRNRSQARSESESASATFRIHVTAAQAYMEWRDFERLPRFMAHIESVRVLDDRRSQWTAKGPGDTQLRWHAEITHDQADRRIAWRSLPGSEISTSGYVEFNNDPHGRGCYVRAEVQYSNPLGATGRALVTALGKNPNFVVKEDLRRFKALLEAGEAPTTVGQTHGPRGLHGRVEQVLFRETSNHPLPQAS